MTSFSSFKMTRIFLKATSLIYREHLLQRACKNAPITPIFSIKVRQTSTMHKAESDREQDAHSFIYVKTDAEYATGKKHAIRKLQDLFDLSKYVAQHIVTKYKSFRLITGEMMTDNYHRCKGIGITDQTLLNYPEILAQKDLEEKLPIYEKLHYNPNWTAPLLVLNLKIFKTFIEKLKNEEILGGRIKTLAQLFQIPEVELCDSLTKKPFLRNINLEKAQKNYKILTDLGVSPQEITRDYWVLQYSDSVIQERLGFAKEHKIDQIKTWMVRAQPQIFETYVNRRSEKKSILGENSLTEYLAERLDCTVDQIKCIIAKNPAIENKSMKKMKEIIDFLFAEGFEPLHIVRTPKILLHKVETTRKRLNELKELGIKVDSLYMMTKSQKQYKQNYDILVKCRKSKVS